jgi:DNA-binding PadR family transcriptional regulator
VRSNDVPDLFGDPGEGIGLAARVIVHLAALGRLGPNDIAQLEYTQQGMVARLDVHQGSLVKVLQSLEAGDVVQVERRFVGGVNRRLKVYLLTAIGESAARDIRHRAALSPPSRPAGDWVASESERDRSGAGSNQLGA